MQILLLGSGGREHALAWKLSQSNLVHHIFVCPGNGGTSREPKTTNLDLPMSDFAKITKWAVANDVRIYQNAIGYGSLDRRLPWSFRDQSNL